MLTKIALLLLAAAAPLGLAGTAARASDEPTPVERVDLARYMGHWFEIARYPNRFQKSCAGDVVATYTLLEDGRIEVENKCRLADGTTIRAVGAARNATDDGSNSRLKVRFAPAALSFLPFVWADYWILGLASDYSHAVVGTPDRDYLWLLARTPDVSDGVYEALLDMAAAQGFDTSRLRRTAHSE